MLSQAKRDVALLAPPLLLKKASLARAQVLRCSSSTALIQNLHTSESLSMTTHQGNSLGKLPAELLGKVYKEHLPDRGSKQALLSSSKSTREHLLGQFTKVTITEEQIFQSCRNNPLDLGKPLPPGVRTLAVEGARDSAFTLFLGTLLRPEKEDVRDRVQHALENVKELELWDWAAHDSASSPCEIIYAPQWSLEKLSFKGKSSLSASFIVSLASKPSASQLKHLEVPSHELRIASDEHVQALQRLTSLESLAVNCGDDGTWLAALTHLRKLSLSSVPASLRLPASLNELTICEAGMDDLLRLMQCSDASKLPMLKRLELGLLELKKTSTFHHKFSEWLGDRRNFSFVCNNAKEDASGAHGKLTVPSFPAQFRFGVQGLSVCGGEAPECEELATACPQLKRISVADCSGIQRLQGIFRCMPGIESVELGFYEDDYPKELESTVLGLCKDAACVAGVSTNTLEREVVLDLTDNRFLGENFLRFHEDMLKIESAWRSSSSKLSEQKEVCCSVSLRILGPPGLPKLRAFVR